MFQLLICEDDLQLQTLMTKYLTKEGYTCHVSQNGKEALQQLENVPIDLLITDIMMPIMDGHALVQEVKMLYPKLPIMMYSALESLSEKQKGYEAGIDDYIVKPINFKELVFKVQALLKRAEAISKKALIFKHSHLSYETKTYQVQGQDIQLTKKEFELLFYLLSKPNVIVTRESLMLEIWGYHSTSDDRTIDTHIKRLREKVSSLDFEIVTVRGLGYKGVLK